MATLGHTTDEATTSSLASQEMIVFGPYTAPGSGTITSITGRLDGLQASGVDTDLTLIVFADSAGSPAAKVAVSSTGTMVASTAVADVAIAASGSITGGTAYWIGIYVHTVSASCIRQFYVASGGAGAGYAFRTIAGVPDPFGTPDGTGNNFLPTYYLTYTPSGSNLPLTVANINATSAMTAGLTRKLAVGTVNATSAMSVWAPNLWASSRVGGSAAMNPVRLSGTGPDFAHSRRLRFCPPPPMLFQRR